MTERDARDRYGIQPGAHLPRSAVELYELAALLSAVGWLGLRCNHPTPWIRSRSGPPAYRSTMLLLLQLRILGFRLLVDGDVGVGVFPESEEVLVSCTGFGTFARENVGTAQPKFG